MITPQVHQWPIDDTAADGWTLAVENTRAGPGSSPFTVKHMWFLRRIKLVACDEVGSTIYHVHPPGEPGLEQGQLLNAAADEGRYVTVQGLRNCFPGAPRRSGEVPALNPARVPRGLP